MTPSRRLALALACAAAACAQEERGRSPRISAVEPPAGYGSVETPIAIRGEGFLVEPYQTAEGAGAVDATFRVWVGATELRDVAWVSERELRARVPTGLPAGTHRIELLDPRGAGAELLDAYTIVPGAPPALTVAAEVAPAVASLGQPVTITVAVTNGGGHPARAVVPAVSGVELLALAPAAPAQADVLPGETRTFFLEGTAAAQGTAALRAGAAGLDGVTGATVIAPDVAAGTLLVQPPSLLSASARAAPERASVGQLVEVELTYANAPGAAPVNGLQPELSATVGGGDVAVVAAPGPCDVPGGATCVATFLVRAARAGVAELRLDAAGTDGNSGAPVAAPRASVALALDAGPSLSAVATAVPARANVGQPVLLSVAVTNAGDVAALDVALSAEAALVPAAPAAAPPPQDVPAGETRTFTWAFTPQATGTGVLVASATGRDANGAGPVSTGSVLSNEVVVDAPARLAAAFVPSALSPTAGFVVALEVANPVDDPGCGQAAALGVHEDDGLLAVVEGEGLLTAAEVACAPLEAGPVDLAPGGAAVLRWTCSAARIGVVRLAASVSGTDGNDGRPVAAAAAESFALDEAAEVVSDPFGDATAFSFVFAYDGHVFLGPSGDGRGVVRCAPDGTGCASFAFSFAYDTTESVGGVLTGLSRNAPPIGCPTPVTTLGAVGYCNPDTPTSTPCSCGPDLESGRGLFTSVRLGAAQDEWLVAMGRTKKAGELNYAYMTRSTTAPLAFSYADLYVAMPPAANVENPTSVAVLDDRIYFGLQVETTGDQKVESTDAPRVAVLTRPPTAPGLDAVGGDAFAITFQGTAMSENGTSIAITQMDAMLGFEGRLFVANRRAVLVSRTGAPPASDGAADAFDDCTPTADWAATGISGYPSKRDVTPADHGVSGLAAWGGKLYLARNTRAGVPELWAFAFAGFEPATGRPVGCADRSGWRRIATSFGSATRTHATALFASESFLYYGMDDATAGLALFRTASPAPLSEADFTGRQGCAAPCEPVGRAGFGAATNGRFFDARAIPFGGADQVWATVGDGASAVRVYRIAE